MQPVEERERVEPVVAELRAVRELLEGIRARMQLMLAAFGVLLILLIVAIVLISSTAGRIDSQLGL